MLWAAPDGLHRRPGVAVPVDQIPARLDQIGSRHAASLIQRLGRARGAVREHPGPDTVGVTRDHGMGAAMLPRLVREQGGMDAAEHDPSTALACRLTQLVTTVGVFSVDANADDVAGRELGRVERFESLVGQDGVAPGVRHGARQDEHPARRDDGHAERQIAGIDDVDTHGRLPSAHGWCFGQSTEQRLVARPPRGPGRL